jgi:GT2 family glycosyltransferase
MIPPMICFITWNRLGLTVKNITALLSTTDEFELYIIDNNSQDGTWKFIQSLTDKRIKCKKRFDVNRGVVYAINYALSKRKKEQYFILVENDVCIKTKDFVTQFLRVMEEFPELGMLSATREALLLKWKSSLRIIKKGNYFYYYHTRATVACHCMRPELLNCIGYWNEETYGCDSDTRARINNFTSFKIGFIPRAIA